MRMDKYLRRLAQIEGEVTVLTLLAGEKSGKMEPRRNSDRVESRDTEEDAEEPETGRRKMRPPLEPLRSDDPYATTVKPVEREEPDSPAVGMMPWVD